MVAEESVLVIKQHVNVLRVIVDMIVELVVLKRFALMEVREYVRAIKQYVDVLLDLREQIVDKVCLSSIVCLLLIV